MAALPEKFIWPLVGVIVFAVLAAFYYDDRRRFGQEQVASNEATSSDASAEYSDASAQSKPAEATSKQSASKLYEYESAVTDHKGFSGSIEDYLAEISAKRDAELIAAAREHSGYTGSIDNYLSGAKPTRTSAKPSSKATYSQQTVGGTQATSMTMEEYLAKTESGGASSPSKEAYSGSMEGYLDKYGDGKQTPIANKTGDPFNKEGHMGFHGSYEEYAKIYN